MEFESWSLKRGDWRLDVGARILELRPWNLELGAQKFTSTRRASFFVLTDKIIFLSPRHGGEFPFLDGNPMDLFLETNLIE